MTKHHLRNRLKSIVGNLVDPAKDEELKGSNIETEDNYNQILELLKEEDQQDKSKLIGLIQEFHNRYQSIYVRYDQITGKLKEKVYSKNEKDSSSSSSSDSDSDNSSSKNGKLKNNVHTLIDRLKEEVQAANIEIDELKRKLEVETEEKVALNSQLQETENMFHESKLQADGFQEENSKLLSELEGVKGEVLKMNEKLKTTEEEVSNLIQKLETTELDNKSLSAECGLLREKLSDKETEFLKQMQMHEWLKNEAESKTKGVEEEVLALQKKLEDTETESRSQIDLLTAKINNLSAEKLESDNQLEKCRLEVSDYMIKIESLREEITNKNRDQERLLEENNTLEAKIKDLESKLEVTSKEIQSGLESKEQIVEQLEETIEDLRSDLEIKGEEVNSLTETVRNLEVKIRLANQKLRVTEQELNGTEHEYATKEEKLQQENKSLMEKISTLSQTITTIRREVQEKLSETLTGIDSLTVKFEEDYGHITTRVYEITNKVDATQVQMKQMKENLTQNVEQMAMKLEVSEGENETLKKSLEDMKRRIVKKDEKIKELETVICLKDEGISDLGKDKREAIKQLCIWADYQRDRCDKLQEILLKTTIGARRQTVSG